MRRALALARLGWGQTAPNPMVGAVVVAGETVVGEGFHARYGEAHAERAALGDAGNSARGATLYVTLEPCAHHGKTPPCTEAVIAAGIARVVVAIRDPTPQARGGAEALRAAGIRVDIGLERDAAAELNASFFAAQCLRRPWVTLKLAVSADGGIAADGARRWITGSEARAETHRQRANADAVGAGVGTILSDDPALTVRGVTPARVPPRRAVFDRQLRTPLDAQVVRTAREVPTIIVGGVRAGESRQGLALTEAGAQVLSTSSLGDALRQLRGGGVQSLYLEGGARIAGAFVSDRLVDRLIIFRSPVVLGSSALQAFAFAPPEFQSLLAERRVVERRAFGDDDMTIYALEDVPCLPD